MLFDQGAGPFSFFGELCPSQGSGFRQPDLLQSCWRAEQQGRNMVILLMVWPFPTPFVFSLKEQKLSRQARRGSLRLKFAKFSLGAREGGAVLTPLSP